MQFPLLIQAKPGLGDSSCSRFLHKHHKAHGVDEHIHYKWSVGVKKQVSYEACEEAEEINRVVQTFRKCGWVVKILTSRGLEMKEMTLRHIKEAGLDFSLGDVIFKEFRPDASGKLLPKDENLEQWMRSQPEWGSKKSRKNFIPLRQSFATASMVLIVVK